MVPGRRHEPVRASDRERLSAGGQQALDDLRLISVLALRLTLRRGVRLERNCGGSYLCTARSGYDGLGTPNGPGGL